MNNFNDDLIRRKNLPGDVFELLHDLAYDHEGRDRKQYRTRAQAILKHVDRCSDVILNDKERVTLLHLLEHTKEGPHAILYRALRLYELLHVPNVQHWSIATDEPQNKKSLDKG